MALGFQSLMWRLLGTIPGPLFFGALFDSSCVYWQFNCGQRGNCWVYDNQSLANLAFTTGIVALTIALGFYIVTWLTYPKRQLNEPPQHPINEILPAADVKDQSKDKKPDDLGEKAAEEREKNGTLGASTTTDLDAVDKSSNGAASNHGDTAQVMEMQSL